jgi:hypothetical protein
MLRSAPHLRRGALLIRGPSCVGFAMGPGSAEQRKSAAPRPGHERNLLTPPCGDLPVGQFVDRRVESPLQKYSCFHSPQITSTTPAIPSHTEGRIAIVTDVGAGCGGRGSVLRATGLQGGFFESVSDQQHADERCFRVRQNRVVLTPRRWRQVCGCCVGPTGRGHNGSPQATVAKEPGHRGEPDISR